MCVTWRVCISHLFFLFFIRFFLWFKDLPDFSGFTRSWLSLIPWRLCGKMFCMVRIIVSHFANCEVNSSYCDGNVVNHEKNAKQFFSQGEFNSSTLYFSTLYPNDIHILFIHCIILSKRVLLILKITSQITKNTSQFLKKTFPNNELKASLRSAHLVRSDFQWIIRTLFCFSGWKRYADIDITGSSN